MRTIKVLEKPALFGLKQQTVVIKKHLGVHSSSITLLRGSRMLLRKWLGTSGLAATLQSNKSPTSNSSIKVSPKTFKVIHSFSKKRDIGKVLQHYRAVGITLFAMISFLPTSFIFTLYVYL